MMGENGSYKEEKWAQCTCSLKTTIQILVVDKLYVVNVDHRVMFAVGDVEKKQNDGQPGTSKVQIYLDIDTSLDDGKEDVGLVVHGEDVAQRGPFTTGWHRQEMERP